MSIAKIFSAPDAAEVPSTEIHGPYKFLDYFDERDEASFAGRDRDIDEVLARISHARTFVMFGRSGLGKTSLLKAGIFPQLRERGDRPIYVRTLSAPLRDLLTVLAEEAKCDGLEPITSDPSLEDGCRWIAAMAEAGPVVLILDQFEEFFIRFRGLEQQAARAEFIAAIVRLVEDSTLDLRVVFSLREDYLAELDEYRSALPGLFDNRYRLSTLTAFGSQEAIVRPLRINGISYSQALVTQLVELLRRENFDPSMLQIVCTEVYRQAATRGAENPHLTETELIAVGGFEGILKNYLTVVSRSLRKESGFVEEYLLLARAILDAMITRENTKRAVTVRDLTESRFRAEQDEIVRILRVLESRRLIRREVRDDEEWYELIHERLVQPVQDWLNQDQEFFNYQIARDLVENSSWGERWRTRPKLLLNNGQIDGVVNPYRARLRLDEMQTEYLFQSAMYAQSPDASYWAERFGWASSKAILLDAFKDPDGDLRLGAALVACHFDDADGRIRASLYPLAADPSQKVKIAVGRSLAILRRRSRHIPAAITTDTRWRFLPRWATLALPTFCAWIAWMAQPIWQRVRNLRAGISRVWSALRQHGIAAAMRQIFKEFTGAGEDLDLVAGMVLGGDDLREYSIIQRFRAMLRADTEIRKTHSESIKALQSRAIRSGAVAATVWSLVSGVTYIGFASTPNLWLLSDPVGRITLVLLLIGLGLLGGLFGWASAGVYTPAAIRGDHRFSPLAPMRSKLVAVILGGMAMGFAGSHDAWVLVFGNGERSTTGFVILIISSIMIASGVIDRFVTLALRSESPVSRTGIWPWALMMSAPFLYAAIVANSSFGGYLFSDFSWLSILSIALSFLVVVIAVARSRIRISTAAVDEIPRRPSHWSRGICLLIFATTMARFGWEKWEAYQAAQLVATSSHESVTIPSPSTVQEAVPTPIDPHAQALEEARLHLSESRWPDAISAYQHALEIGPESASVRSELANVFAKANDLDGAIRESRRAVSIDRENAKYQNSLAWNLCLMGRYKEALPHARKSVSLRPDAANLDTLAHAAYGTENWYEAVLAWRAMSTYGNTPTFLTGDHCNDDQVHYEDALRRVNEDETNQRSDSSTVAPPDALPLRP